MITKLNCVLGHVASSNIELRPAISLNDMMYFVHLRLDTILNKLFATKYANICAGPCSGFSMMYSPVKASEAVSI